MNKKIVIILLLIPLLSLMGLIGYVVYDEFINDDGIELKDYNKEELCDECNCNDDNDEIENEGESYHVEHSGIYTKDGKIYKLDVYTEFSDNVKIENIKLNNKTLNLEIINQILYVNNKKVNYVDKMFVTNNQVLIGVAGQLGLGFIASIDSNGNITNLDNNKTLGSFQASEVYLMDNGNIVAIGGECCEDETANDNKIVEFSYINDKLELMKKTK